MHEIAISKEIVKQAKEQAGKGKKITAVVIEVGELSSLTPEELTYALKNIVDWDIRVRKVKGVVECACGFKGSPRIIERAHDFVLFECPLCREIPAIIKGKDILLAKVITKVK